MKNVYMWSVDCTSILIYDSAIDLKPLGAHSIKLRCLKVLRCVQSQNMYTFSYTQYILTIFQYSESDRQERITS